ncbi:MAG: VOC family protein [Candidatus Acidiferrales bacterium]
MPRRKSCRKPAKTRQLAIVVPVTQPPEQKQIRGVKLKTVSTFTMIVAILCLAAFVAGRAPVPAEAAMQPSLSQKEPPMFLGLQTATYSVQDLAKAKAWYSEVLGVQPYFDEPFYAGFHVGAYELGLVPEQNAGAKRGRAGVAYWGVADARAAYQRLLDLRATPLEPVQDVGEGILVAAVHDPFGNVLGVIQNPHFQSEGK